MARDYGRIRSVFWNDEKVKGWSLDLKAVAAYLMTSEHANALGAFRLPAAYMSDDLDITPGQARKHLADLQDAGWLRVCQATGWIWIVKYLKHNKPENVNVEKHVRSLIALVPPTVSFFADLMRAVSGQDDTGSEGSSKGIEGVSNNRTQPEPEPEPEPSRKEGVGASAPPPPAEPPVDFAEVAEAYNQAAEACGWPRCNGITGGRKPQAKARLAEAGGIDGWRNAMARARASPFLRGETGRTAGHENWRPDIDFFLKPKSFTKLLEGGYDGNQNHHTRSAPRGKPAISDGWVAGALSAIETLEGG